MKEQIIGGVLAAVAVATVTGLAVEYWQWRAGRRIIDQRQMLLRLLGGLILLTILGMILVGVLLVDWQSVVSFAIYWSLCLALVFGLMVLALADWRRVLERQLEREKELGRAFAQALREGRASSTEGPQTEPSETS